MGEEVAGKEGLDDLFGFSVLNWGGLHPGKEDLDGFALEVEGGEFLFFRLSLTDVPAEHKRNNRELRLRLRSRLRADQSLRLRLRLRLRKNKE